jgi:Fe-S-cluster-containing hydrogenase component 2
MSRYIMVIDTRRCVGCQDCVVACQTENNVPSGYCRDWITETAGGEYPTVRLEIRSERCNHCDNPPCVHCCPTGASHVHERGGVVLVTPEKCIGCKACLASCPYDARFIHPKGYARQVHILYSSGRAGARSRLRFGLPDALHALWGRRGSVERREPSARNAAPPHAPAGGGDQAAHLLPDLNDRPLFPP